MTFDARTALEDPAIRGDREPPVMVASREVAEALEKLTAVIAALEGRVEPVRSRNRMDQDDDGKLVRADRPEEIPSLSPLAHELVSHAHQIGRIGRRISRIIEELEI